MPTTLPKGIWYEKSRNRYRVKLYKNATPHLAGYFRTPAEALQAYHKLKNKLNKIPKTRKQKKPAFIFPEKEGIINLFNSIKKEDFNND